MGERIPIEMERVPLCACGEPLSRHQPDVNDPTWLIGVCSECGSRYQIDAIECVMVRLPDTLALT